METTVSYLLTLQFKAKNSKIKDGPLSLGNFSTDFTINNVKKKYYKEV